MSRLRSLLRDARGVTLLEFAISLPPLLTLMMGLGELAYQNYVQAVLIGAVQKAARDEGIQSALTQTDAIDAKVENAVLSLVKNAQFNPRSARRTNYDNYSSVAGEPFTDSKYPANGTGTYDGVCNHGETYIDLNANGQYDLDLSSSGEGGASDLTRYTVTVTYHRLFPIGFFGWGSTVTLTATTLLRNQPYAVQSVYNNNTTGTCP